MELLLPWASNLFVRTRNEKLKGGTKRVKCQCFRGGDHSLVQADDNCGVPLATELP